MTARLIDGKAIAARIRAEIADKVRILKTEHGIIPGLATVLVGDNPASHTYVSSKQKACAEAGIDSFGFTLPADVTQAELDTLLAELNARPDVHGILVQLPLPAHLDEERALNAISLTKDVDGFHPLNIGRLAMKDRTPLFVPATPAGVIRLLDEIGTPISGARAVVLGRSNIVGMPVALLLLHRDATVDDLPQSHARFARCHTSGRYFDRRRGTASNGQSELGQARRNRDRRGHQPDR